MKQMRETGDQTLLNIEAMHNDIALDIEDCMSYQPSTVQQEHFQPLPLPTDNLDHPIRDRYGKASIRTFSTHRVHPLFPNARLTPPP